MLSLFPTLFSFEPLGPFVLRVTLGVILAHWAYGRVKAHTSGKTTTLGLIEGVVGILLIIGLLTQLAALVTLIITFVQLIVKVKHKAFFTDGVNYYFLIFVIALALLFVGPGAFAFDYPL